MMRKLLMLALLASAAAAIIAIAAAAKPPASNGRIAFTRFDPRSTTIRLLCEYRREP